MLAGKEYGSGSSRDWAAKGTLLLGVKAVIAESYERIHRSNLVNMGVLPLQYLTGQSASSLGLTGRERYTVTGIADGLRPGRDRHRSRAATATRSIEFQALARIDTPEELVAFRHGGILPYVLRQLVGKQLTAPDGSRRHEGTTSSVALRDLRAFVMSRSMDRLTSLDIKQKARELGFDLCGIAPAADLPELAFFRDWLARGYAGEMAYLHRSAEQRADVRRVLPSARTVIVTGTIYNTDRPVFDRDAPIPAARRSRATPGATTITT